MSTVFVENPDVDCELKLTILLTRGDAPQDVNDPNVSVMVEPIPVRTSKIVEMVEHAPRDDPATKDTNWAIQRQSLEDSKGDDVDEVVMYDSNGVVSEGLSSNFAVLIGDVIHTAPSDAGTKFHFLFSITTH